MRTKLTPLERSTGLFVIAVAATLVLAAVAGGGRVADLVRSPFRLHLRVDRAHGIRAGAPVLVHGVQVGTVVRAQLAPSDSDVTHPVLVDLDVEPEAARQLRTDSKVTVAAGMPPYMIGVVELAPGKGAALATGATLVAKAEDSAIVGLLADSRLIVSDVKRLTAEMERTSHSMLAVANAMKDGPGLAARLIRDPKLADEVDALLHDARVATVTAQGILRKTDGVLADVPTTLRNARTLSGDALRLAREVESSLAELRQLARSADRTIKLAEELANSLKTTASYAPELVRKADVSLGETKRLIGAAQKNILLRGLLDAPETPRTEATVRVPVAPPATSGAQ